MAGDRWLYTPEICDGHECIVDCDRCGYREEIFEAEDTMNDYISRQAAIDEIKGFKQGAAEWRDEQEECSDIWHRADSAIASALEIGLRVKKIPSAQQWIPCSERPPEEDFWSGRGRQFSDHVFVTIVNHANDDEHFTDIAQTVDGIWRLSHDVDGDCSLPNWCEVIAWMPLPEPYKGEE